MPWVDSRTVIRTASKAASRFLLLSAPLVNGVVNVPLTTYALSFPTPSIQQSGNQSIAVPLTTYSITAFAPTLVSTGVPPIYANRGVSQVDARTYLKTNPGRTAFWLTNMFPNAPALQVPLTTYSLTFYPPTIISNPAFLGLGNDSTVYPDPPPVKSRQWNFWLLASATANKVISVPLTTYSITTFPPSIQQSGEQTVNVPVTSYALTFNAPLIQGSAISITPAAYTITMFAPTITTSYIDTTRPHLPIIESSERGTVNISWAAPAHSVAIVSYRIYVNGVFAVSSSTLVATITGLLIDTQYTITITAVDANGVEFGVFGELHYSYDSQSKTTVNTLAGRRGWRWWGMGKP